ncbi:hypothetical protein [Mameliella alba]|uniref:hypothetical protein n=1 Tax=Mameliella alba TaxID=561184 RepID=UPI00094253C0|nr:hypothetical protein [Mameliella alba]OWV49699.1 hypothetical protein CDZ96_04800 [Mameliella alba]GGF53611.1 hypothetical protein GCM10011319_13830 [Mameliella alba]
MREIAALEAWNHWDGEQSVARDLLARLFRALSEAAEALRINRVDRYVEKDIDTRVQQIGLGLDTPNGPFWPDFDSVSVEEIFDAAFLAMRMLDEKLFQEPYVIMPELLDEFETKSGYFVLPCRKITGDPEHMTGQGLSRRGLLYHRIAPVQHDGVRLALNVHPDVGLTPGHLPSTRKVGAAVFSDLQLETRPSEINAPGNFIVTGLTADPQQEQAVTDQCREAVAAGCDTLVWPELTMPPDRVEQVRRLLRDKPLDGDRPAVVVAGSWHVEGDKRFRNRGEVLDGRGERILCFDKCLAYMERGTSEGGAEDIEPGETVQLLLAEDELIVFMICLDFCHVNRLALLEACDASLVIVPSMGEGSTIREHTARAAVLQTTNNTRTVVVQQRLKQAGPSKNALIGYILPGAAKPLKFTENDTLTSRRFSSFYTEGEKPQ